MGVAGDLLHHVVTAMAAGNVANVHVRTDT